MIDDDMKLYNRLVTDEMVKIAQQTWRFAGKDHMRAAIEAIAPMLIAQGMREAAEISANEEVHWIAEEILARAQELDPK